MSARSERREEKKRIKEEKREERRNRYTKREKRQVALVGVMAIVALVLLVSTSKIFWSENSPAVEVSTTTQGTSVTTPTTPAPTTPAPTEPSESQQTTEKPSANSGETEKEPSTENKTEKPQAETKEEILKKVVDGVNSLKASDASFIGKKNQYIDIRLTDCSVPQVVGIINGVLERFLGEEKLDYDFTNGVSKDPEGNGEITSMAAIPPSFIEFGLTADGVTNAYVEKDGENTKYTIEVVPEDSSIGEKPYHHSKACDVMSLESLNIPAKITRADYTYSGTKISVTYNAEGKVIEYHEYFDMKGDGEGGAMGVTATLTLEGYFDETWEIQWK